MTHGDSTSKELALSDQEVRLAEAHRGFVREMDQHLGRAYGFGGASVIAVMCMVVFLGWFFSLLTSAILYILGFTAALGTLYLARQRIYAHRERLKERVLNYCAANDIDPELLREYYEAEEVYSFFSAIFEEPPRLPSADQPAAEH